MEDADWAQAAVQALLRDALVALSRRFALLAWQLEQG